MNIESIKRSGFELGLKAELSIQQAGFNQNIKESRWAAARQCALNCVDLLNELMKLRTAIPKPEPNEGVIS